MRDAIQELRTLQFDLSPPVLYQEGLAAALDWLVSNTRERFGVNLSFLGGEPLPDVGQDLGVVLFQCARELINNLVRHSGASRGSVELGVRDGELRLVVSDDGKGISEPSPGVRTEEGTGYGLFSVRDRLTLLGGELSFESGTRGTRALVRVPWPLADEVAPGDLTPHR